MRLLIVYHMGASVEKMYLKFVADTLRKARLIIRREVPQAKTQLLFAYLKLRMNLLLLRLFPRLRVSRQTFLRFRVEFFDYETLVFLFEEIFVNQDYYFKATTDSPVIIDAGSNIGVSLLFFKWLYPRSKIIAFEPDEQTFALLKRNVEANKLQDVQLHNKALHRFKGLVEFYYDTERPGCLHMSTKKERHLKSCKRIESALLSDYIQGEVEFVKMDVEGAEAYVIQELTQRNKLRLIKEMVVEYHHHLAPNDDKFSEALGTLENNGFGYQISTALGKPFKKEQFQDILVYAYRK